MMTCRYLCPYLHSCHTSSKKRKKNFKNLNEKRFFKTSEKNNHQNCEESLGVGGVRFMEMSKYSRKNMYKRIEEDKLEVLIV